MLAHTQQLKQKVSTYGAAERWVQSCYMRYLEVPVPSLPFETGATLLEYYFGPDRCISRFYRHLSYG